MKKDIVILGAGGFGREVLQWCLEAGYDQGQWRIKGFVDDNPGALKDYPDVPLPVLGGFGDYTIGADDYFVCALGQPKVKKACLERIPARGGRPLSVIHPTAKIGRNARLGEGCVICPQAILTVDIQVGDFVVLNCYASVGHDARIGSWSTLSAYCNVTGHVELGQGVFMGSHAAVIPQVRVGDWATIGAGSVACQNVPPAATVLGVPARTLYQGS